MKHPALHFEQMTPLQLMHFLTERHYPSTLRVMEATGIHISTAVKANAYIHPFLPALEEEYKRLAALCARQINKNIRILFPFIDNALEEGVINRDEIFANLEFETEELHQVHMEMRTLMANIADLSHGFRPGPVSSETMKIAFSELHTFEQHLYRQFYLEDVLLMPKINKLVSQAANHNFID